MRCLVKFYCSVCKTEYSDWVTTQKAECPNCKGKTDYSQVFELETLSVG